MIPQEVLDELHALLTSGAKLSRLQRMKIVCGHGRELGQVLRVSGRDVLVFRRTAVTYGGFEGHMRPLKVKVDAWQGLGLLDRDTADGVAEMGNRCCSRRATVGDLLDAADSGKRTLVLR